jgi:hypothetical protein
VITAVGKDPPADVACWAVVHIDAQGRVARAFPPPLGGAAMQRPWDRSRCETTFEGANLVYGIRSSTIFSDPVLADLDGDGEPEIFVRRDGKHQNTDIQGTDLVWTFREGAVEPLPGSRGLGVEAMRDADADGRLDLVTHDPYRGEGGFACGLVSLDSYRVVGPELLVHARPDGTFSLDDAEAKAFARKQCPARPKRIGGRKGRVGHDIGCAHLWGASERDIVRDLASCAPRPGEAYEPHCPDWCEYEKDYVKKFTAAPPPLRLDVP